MSNIWGTCGQMAAAASLYLCCLPGMTKRKKKVCNTLQVLNVMFVKRGALSPVANKTLPSLCWLFLLPVEKQEGWWSTKCNSPGQTNCFPHCVGDWGLNSWQGYGFHVGLGTPVVARLGTEGWALCFQWVEEVCPYGEPLHCVLKCLTWGTAPSSSFQFWQWCF